MRAIGPAVAEAVFDHVIIVVRDLDKGAEALRRDFGLVATGGGVHPGVGTGNRIVPVQGGYVELMGIVNAEQARESWLGQKVSATLDSGCALFDWMMRTKSVDSVRADFAAAGWALEQGAPGSRAVAGGGTVRWIAQNLAGTPNYRRGMPFFIEWCEVTPQHPSVLEPKPDMPRLTGLVIGAASGEDEAAIREITGTAPVEIAIGSEPGLIEVRIESGGRSMVIPRSWGL